MMLHALDVAHEVILDLRHLLFAAADDIADEAVEMLRQLRIVAVAPAAQRMRKLQGWWIETGAVGVDQHRHGDRSHRAHTTKSRRETQENQKNNEHRKA